MSAPQSFLCPITGEIMADPVSTTDGFSYEREAISEWFVGHNTSPLTGAPLDKSTLVPNHTLRAAIQEYVNAHPHVGDDIYRPRDLGAIRQTINSRQWASPGQPIYPESSYQESSVPMGQAIYPDAQPVAVALPIASQPMMGGVVRAPPPPPLDGMTIDDRNASCAFAVPDWPNYLVPYKKASAGFFGMGGSSAQGHEPHPDDPKIRVIPAAGGGVSDGRGGVTLEVSVRSEASLLRLVRRLVAKETAPIAALRLKAEEGDGFGRLAEGFSADGEAFALLTRALHVVSGKGAEPLLTLVELSISMLSIGPGPCAAFATALTNHPTLRKLELWNCAVDDEGAMCLGALAAPGANAALSELNLGRNLISGDCRERLAEIVEKQRVHFQAY